MTNRERNRVLYKIADAVEAQEQRLAELETYDTGLPITQAKGQARRAAENFRFFADLIVAQSDDTYKVPGAQLNYVNRKPVGVAGLITPWNTCDKMGALRISDQIERGPGRHGVSNAFYLYLRDPDGHRVEIYTQDYYTGEPDNPTVTWDVLTIPLGLTYGPQAALFAEMFPAAIRYSGGSIGYAIGAILGGAFAPMIAQALVNRFHTTTAVSTYLFIFTAMALAATFTIKDRTGKRLDKDARTCLASERRTRHPDGGTACGPLPASSPAEVGGPVPSRN